MWKCESVYNLISCEHLHFEKYVRFSNTWLGLTNKQTKKMIQKIKHWWVFQRVL